MPQPSDPLELTRGLYASLNARDFDAVMARFDADAVWDVSRWGLGTHSGTRAIHAFLKDWFGTLERYDVEVQELSRLGERVVFAIVLQTGRRTRTRGVLQVRSAPVYVWRGSLIKSLTVYRDVEHGRAAAAEAGRSSVQRNVAVHEEIVAAIRSGAVPEHLLAAGFRMENHAAAATDHAYYGVAGMREWASDIFEVFAADARYGVEEVVAAGETFVVAMFSVVGRGALTGQPLAFRWAGVTWFRAGKATHAVGYASRAEALASVAAA